LKEEVITESLKCILTDKERLELGDKQAKDIGELGRLEDQLKGVTGQIKAQQKEVEARLKATSETIRNGYQYRDVEVTKKIDGEIAKYYRHDTGECYKERGIFPSERQMILEVTRQSATAMLEAAQQRKESVEPLTESTGEPQNQGQVEGQAGKDTPELVEGSRSETVDQSSVVGVSVGSNEGPVEVETVSAQGSVVTAKDLGPEDLVGDVDVPEHIIVGTIPVAPAFDGEAKEFMDQATPLQRSIILDPVRTRDEMLASAGAAIVPQTETKEPEKDTKSRKK